MKRSIRYVQEENSKHGSFRFWQILILYYYDEFSTKEIAKILDIPQGTVKSRLARGRKQLKDLLEMEGEGAYEGA